jgi:hypothetical protein
MRISSASEGNGRLGGALRITPSRRDRGDSQPSDRHELTDHDEHRAAATEGGAVCEVAPQGDREVDEGDQGGDRSHRGLFGGGGSRVEVAAQSVSTIVCAVAKRYRFSIEDNAPGGVDDLLEEGWEENAGVEYVGKQQGYLVQCTCS